MIAFVGVQWGTPYLGDVGENIQNTLNSTFFNNQDTVEEKVKPNQDTEVANGILEDSRLKTLLTYLPFLGIKISNVEAIANPKIESSEAVSFTYNSNVFSLYQIDTSSEKAKEIVSLLEGSHVLEVNGKSYVGIAASDYVILVEDVKDLSLLVKSIHEVNEVLTSLGFKKVSLKFE